MRFRRPPPQQSETAVLRTDVARGLEKLFGGSSKVDPRYARMVVLSFFASVALVTFFGYDELTTPWEQEMFSSGIQARISLDQEGSVEVPNRYGDGILEMSVAEAQVYTSAVFDRVLGLLQLLALGGAVVGVVVVVAILRSAKRRGSEDVSRKLRGSEIEPVDKLTARMTAENLVGDYEVIGVPLMPGREKRNILSSGSTGAGKTEAMRTLMRQVRELRQRALVFDPDQQFAAEFYEPERGDVILNPFDKRMPGWTIWGEYRKTYELHAIAKTLFPRLSKEPYWDDAPRQVFEDIVRHLDDKNDRSNASLYRLAACVPTDELHKLIEGRPGAQHISPEGEKRSDSVRSGLATITRIWEHLKDPIGEEPFSIRRFVNDDSSAGWLFISTNERELPTVLDLLRVWSAIWVDSILSLDESDTRRIWTFLDEFATLGKLRLVDLLSRGRKRGSCTVLGMQNMAQVEEVYGSAGATTIRGNCATWLVLQQPDAASAEIMSQTLGEEEVLELTESLSEGAHGATMSTSKRRTSRRLVSKDELMNLPELTAYMRQTGLPVTKVAFPYRGNSRSESRSSGDGVGQGGPLRSKSTSDLAASMGF